MTKVIKETKGIHFHVYNGNNPEHFRGKYYFSPEEKLILMKIIIINKKKLI